MSSKIVHILDGQGGYIFSAGMHTFGSTLSKDGYEVHHWGWTQHRQVALALALAPSSAKLALLGFSLGGNACAWIANDKSVGRPIDLLVAYDPTVNGPPLSNYPIRANVKRAICYRQMGWMLTSFMFGRGKLYGDKVEEHQFYGDHLAVPYRQDLHAKTRKALEVM